LHEVASGLEDRFGLLTAGWRVALPRHQTLRAALDWSYDLLPEPEQRLLRHLAVFRSGFTLNAAASVMGDRHEGSGVGDGVSNLVSKSLVMLDASSTGGRWWLLETIRAHALEKLIESGEAEIAMQRHAEFFRTVFAPSGITSQSPLAVTDMPSHLQDIDNVRAALDWCFSHSGNSVVGVELTVGYAPVWKHFELMVEYRDRIEHALDRAGIDPRIGPALRLQLYLGLAITTFFTMGSFERCEIGCVKALEIADRLGDLDSQLRSLWGLWGLQINIGKCRDAEHTARRFSQLANRTGDLADFLVGDRLLGNTLQFKGDQPGAQRYFERVLELYITPKDHRHTLWFHYDEYVLARAMLARVLWLRGFADRAIQEARASFEQAQALKYKYSVCRVVQYAAFPVALMNGNLDAAEQAVATLSDLATIGNSAYWATLARCLEARLLIARGEFDVGVTKLRNYIDGCERSRWTICYIESLGALADGLGELGQTREALVAADRALACAASSGERWYVAKLLRTKGELLFRDEERQSASAAETCFVQALDVAREQDALCWELRAGMSLARLWSSQGRPDDARNVLATCYAKFTEGFDTSDLRSARAMLASLEPILPDRSLQFKA